MFFSWQYRYFSCTDRPVVLARVGMLLALGLLVPSVLAIAPSAYSTTLTTTSAPTGTMNHGDPRLSCTPTAWTDVVTFLLANYVAHAATVKSKPGEPALRSFVALATALIYPTSGIVRGLDAIVRRAVTGSSPLQTAKRAGALCTVVRKRDWQPRSGDVVQGIFTESVGSRHETKWRKSVQSMAQTVAPASVSLAKVIVCPNTRNLLTHNVQHSKVTVGKLQTTATEERNILPDTDNQGIEMSQIGCSTSETSLPTDSYQMDVHYLHQFFEPSSKDYSLNGRKVHGVCSLPPGFALAIVSPEATVLELRFGELGDSSQARPAMITESEISSSSGLAKGLVAIFQTLYACRSFRSSCFSFGIFHEVLRHVAEVCCVKDIFYLFNLCPSIEMLTPDPPTAVTLYQTQGDQIERYGYAAFGLTVIPYLVMSVVNLLSTILTPEYSTLYMVESLVMEEARRRDGAYFTGAVGRLDEKKHGQGSLEVEFVFDQQHRKYIGYHANRQSAERRDCIAGVDEPVEITTNKGASGSTKPTLLIPSNHADPLRSLASKALRGFMLSMAGFMIGLIPLAIYGGLSGFRARESTTPQRVLTMLWLVIGI